MKQIYPPIARRKSATSTSVDEFLHLLDVSRLPGIAIRESWRKALVSHDLPARADIHFHNEVEITLLKHIQKRDVVDFAIVSSPRLKIGVGGVMILLGITLDHNPESALVHDKVGKALPILNGGKLGLDILWNWEIVTGDTAAGKLDGDAKVCQDRLIEGGIV